MKTIACDLRPLTADQIKKQTVASKKEFCESAALLFAEARNECGLTIDEVCERVKLEIVKRNLRKIDTDAANTSPSVVRTAIQCMLPVLTEAGPETAERYRPVLEAIARRL